MILTKMLRGVSRGIIALDPLGKSELTIPCNRVCVTLFPSHFILIM